MVFCPPVKLLVAANSWILGVAMVVSFALILTLSLSTTARTTHPTNLILLFAFTAAEGVLVGAASASVSTNVVIMAFGEYGVKQLSSSMSFVSHFLSC